MRLKKLDLLLSAGLLISLSGGALWLANGNQTEAESQGTSPSPEVEENVHFQPTAVLSATSTLAPTSTPTATPTPKISLVASPRTDPTAFHAGISILTYSDGGDFKQNAPALLDRLAELKINSVALVFPVFQVDWRATEVFTDPAKTPSQDNLRLLIREAHKRNFTVMLRPILDEASLVVSGKWRGQLEPTDRQAWFVSYTSLLVGYAKLAEEEGVEIINVGTEFVSLESDVDQWQALIATVRSEFSGQVTYSANWDVKAPGFVSELDFPSIDGYYPLDAPVGASVDSLVSAWSRWVEDITAKGYDLSRVVFTEVGMLPRQGAYQRPWNYLLETPADYEAQLRYYQATCQVFVPSAGGLYWWHTELTLPDPDKSDLGFNPLGKPAEAALAQCHR